MIACLGEAIVDLVCEREVDSLAEAGEFRPHFGGALANVAVAARRAGCPVALAGGAGEDPWGAWLRERLASEGVDLRWFSLVPGVRTPIAIITFDRHREPSFQVYGEGIEAAIRSLEGRVETVVQAASALVFGSNTLVGQPEREVTLRARRAALDRGLPVIFDPNLRTHRWDDLGRARELCLSVCEGAYCVRTNREEGLWLSDLPGDADPAQAAEAIAASGARLAVVTRGAGGAVARGEAQADQPGREVEVASPLGAGDAFLGALVAGLARRGWRTTEIGEVLAEAVEAAAHACTVWRAVP